MRWLTSKAMWAGAGLVALGIADLVAGDHMEALTKFSEALAVFGIRHGVWKAPHGR